MPVGPVIHRFNRGKKLHTVWKASPLKGFPDLCGVLTRKHPGVMWVMELKSTKPNGKPKGRLTDDQDEWLVRLHEAGAKVAVVHSLDEAEARMKEWGEIF
jgi:hypothetical protein